MRAILFVSAVSMFLPHLAFSEVIRSNAQCWSIGKTLRQNSSSEHTVHSRIGFTLEPNSDNQTATIEYIGHLEINVEWNRDANLPDLASYYGTFNGKGVKSNLSSRARTYTDHDFYRFSDFDAAHTTNYDGGMIWGYLVISKNYFNKDAKTFAAHYVFKSGDHMGGTIDYNCARE